MKTSIRKQSFVIANLTYQSGDFVHSLSGSNVTTQVAGRNITLSVDLSKNEVDGKDDHNRVIDVRQLREDFSDVEFVQLHKERWLEDGLREAAEIAPEPALFWLKLIFKDGSEKTAPAFVKEHNNSFWFYLYQPSALVLAED